MRNISKQKLLCTDLDGTFIGDDASMYQLLEIIKQNNIKLVFSSGRDLALILDFVKEKKIQNPDIAICMVGTEIYFFENGKFVLDQEWKNIISKNWDKKKIVNLLKNIKELKLQPERWQTQFKISYYLKGQGRVRDIPDPTLTLLEKRLKQTNLKAEIIYSGNQFLDILPQNSSKGYALEYLIKKLDVPKNNVLAAGDSGNDLEFFELGFKGIIVGNTFDELKDFQGKNAYHAKAEYSAGIIEGLKYFDFV